MHSFAGTPVQFVSYWETAPGATMPPHIALSIVSIRRALGDSFLLLTPQSTPTFIGHDHLRKKWRFDYLGFKLSPDIESIVARSDFIRMAYVYRYGGVWIDADTLLLKNPTARLFPEGLTHKLHWLSEALFASLPGNPLLGRAVASSLCERAHKWGDPGGIKEIVTQSPEQLTIIPGSTVDPGYRPLYNFATCDVLRQRNLPAQEFLINDIDILKLYNTYISRTTSKQQTVEEFLADGTLLAKIFLLV